MKCIKSKTNRIVCVIHHSETFLKHSSTIKSKIPHWTSYHAPAHPHHAPAHPQAVLGGKWFFHCFVRERDSHYRWGFNSTVLCTKCMQMMTRILLKGSTVIYQVPPLSPLIQRLNQQLSIIFPSTAFANAFVSSLSWMSTKLLNYIMLLQRMVKLTTRFHQISVEFARAGSQPRGQPNNFPPKFVKNIVKAPIRF